MSKQTITKVSIVLVVLSAVIYGLQLAIFHDPTTTVFYIFQDFAFLPISIALATLVVGYILEERDQRARMQKTRMLTSAFFTDLGRDLLIKLIGVTECTEELAQMMEEEHSGKNTLKELEELNIKIHFDKFFVAELKEMLEAHWNVMMVSSSNPMLLDHEEFTDMIWAIFHIRDEMNRRDIDNLSTGNCRHLEGDAARVMELLLSNWIHHLDYVKAEYPYFYKESEQEIAEMIRARVNQ
ncbi:MAG: hypothetical protein KBS66_07690 [Eubacterium sp.]|nr:hypothetical protein [Candidatus Colimonas fimequi]